jgi:hypothetical protein
LLNIEIIALNSSTSKQTIVHNRNKLQSIILDGSTHSLYQVSLPLIIELDNSKSSIQRFARLMHIYSESFDDFISVDEIYANKTPDFLARFLKSIQDKVLVDVSPPTFYSYLNFSRKILRYLSVEHDIGSYDKKRLIDIDVAFEDAELPEINDEKADYYRWWIVKNKTGGGSFIDLTYIWENEGADAARELEKIINGVLGGYRSHSSHLPLFRSFLDYLSTVNEYNYDELKCEPTVVETTFQDFCVHFFKAQLKIGNCLTTAKKRWNDGAPAIASAFFNTKFFAAPEHDITYIPMKYKSKRLIKRLSLISSGF